MTITDILTAIIEDQIEQAPDGDRLLQKFKAGELKRTHGVYTADQASFYSLMVDTINMMANVLEEIKEDYKQKICV